MIPREVEAMFDRLEALHPDRIKVLRLEYQLNARSRSEIELLLKQMAKEDLGALSLAAPPKGAVAGAYRLGDVRLGHRTWGDFGLNEDEWIQHVGVFGRSGSGKTNVGFLILKELVSQVKPFLVFDWKRNYRDLLLRPEFAELKVYTVGRDLAPFRFNPLMPPPGTEPEVFLKKLIEIMMHVYWLGDGVAYLLQTAIDAVYRQADVYKGRPDAFPTLFEVRDWLRAYKTKGRESQWMDSTRRVIETLCFGQVGKVVNTDSNAGFEKLLSGQVVLELDSLSNADKTFLIESLLLWLHQMRMSEPERETFKHAIVIEEAHHVLLKRKESKETVMDVILREIRELGEAIIFLDQHPSLVSTPSLGNSYCTIAMNLKHGNDAASLTRAMLLSDEEKTCLGKLPIGEALVKLQGRWVQPFHVRFPHFAVGKGKVSDDDLRARNLGVSAVAAKIPAIEKQEKEIPVIPAGDRDSKQDGITGVGTRLLEDVMAFPTTGIQERRARLGFSVRMLYFLISSLLDKGLLSSSSVSTPKGRVRILRLTAAGARALGQEGNPIGPMRNESVEHWYWKLRVAELIRRRGYLVEIEKDGADLAVQTPGKRFAIEIETGKSDVEANILRNLKNGYDKVLVVWLHGEPKPQPEDRVDSVRLSEFLQSPPDFTGSSVPAIRDPRGPSPP